MGLKEIIFSTPMGQRFFVESHTVEPEITEDGWSTESAHWSEGAAVETAKELSKNYPHSYFRVVRIIETVEEEQWQD